MFARKSLGYHPLAVRDLNAGNKCYHCTTRHYLCYKDFNKSEKLNTYTA